MLTKVLLISTIFATTQGGFLFNNGPLPIRQQFKPPIEPMPLFRQLRPSYSNSPPPSPPDVRSILSQVPIISNLFRGTQQERAGFAPQYANNIPRFDTRPQNEPTFEPNSLPSAKQAVSDNEVNGNGISDNDKLGIIDETNNSILDDGITSTTEDYETTTDFDLFGRMGPPPAVVASLLG